MVHGRIEVVGNLATEVTKVTEGVLKILFPQRTICPPQSTHRPRKA